MSPASSHVELLSRLTRLNGRALRSLQTRIMALEETLNDVDSQTEPRLECSNKDKAVAGVREDGLDVLISKLREYSMFRIIPISVKATTFEPICSLFSNKMEMNSSRRAP